MLTLQFVPYHEISSLTTEERLDKLINIAKKNKIIVMQGRLKPTEEAGLIQKTMENVGRDFRGIELCTVYPEGRDQKFFGQIKGVLLKFLMGTRDGITIIGPATIVKQIKRNPDKIELLMHNAGRKR
ncbi:MAG: DUF2073 domain-containing protein [archaeon]